MHARILSPEIPTSSFISIHFCASAMNMIRNIDSPQFFPKLSHGSKATAAIFLIRVCCAYFILPDSHSSLSVDDFLAQTRFQIPADLLADQSFTLMNDKAIACIYQSSIENVKNSMGLSVNANTEKMAHPVFRKLSLMVQKELLPKTCLVVHLKELSVRKESFGTK
jgi:hypothetical protein